MLDYEKLKACVKTTSGDKETELQEYGVERAGNVICCWIISEDDKVTKHLPELSDTAFAPATVRHLLDMRSGIKYQDATPEYRAAVGWNKPAVSM